MPSLTVLHDSLRTPALRALAGLLLVVGLWYPLAQLGSAFLLGVSPQPDAWGRDFAAHLLLALLLLLMASSFRRFVVATVLFFSAFTLANALKLAILGGPLMPDDFVAAKNLFLLLEGWQLWASAALVAVPLLSLLWMFAWRQPQAWVLLAGILVAVAALLSWPETARSWMDARFGDWVWNQRGNYQMRGLPIHLVQESARNLARRSSPPASAEVTQALSVLGVQPRAAAVQTVGQAEYAVGGRRNVHMIVLESFWDPLLLHAAGFDADPFVAEFRALWQAGGGGHALSPVFGGYTANAEFEVLCGFPVQHDGVFFEGRLRRDVPCLPRHLGALGYRSTASHPNAAPFWNRINAYRRIGFEHYWSERDFDLDDMNREFLSDASLYRQVLERIGPALDSGEPLFNYVLTYFGHLDYPLNEARPALIKAEHDHGVLGAYANTVHYKTRELMDFLAQLRRRDPEAVIVIFGDHLPALGWNFAGYVESGLLAPQRTQFSDVMFHTQVATPLIVIDGERGPLVTGDLPMYALPALILDLLGENSASMLRFLAPADADPYVRPLPGVHFSVDGAKKLLLCRDGEENAACAPSRAWIAALSVLERDLFSGDQHALRETQRVQLADFETASEAAPAAPRLTLEGEDGDA